MPFGLIWLKKHCYFLIMTHWGRVTHICVIKLTTIGSDNVLSPGRRKAIIWTRCWTIVKLDLRKKPQWNIKRNPYILIQENAFENVVWKMSAILSRPQCVQWQKPHRSMCAIPRVDTGGKWVEGMTTISGAWPVHLMELVKQEKLI